MHGAALLLAFADPVVPEAPPGKERRVVAASLACGADHVDVALLTKLVVRPHNHRDVPLEVAEPPSARLSRAVKPLALATPGRPVAAAEILADVVLTAEGVVDATELSGVGEARGFPAGGVQGESSFGRPRRRRTDDALDGTRQQRRLNPARVTEDRLRNERGQSPAGRLLRREAGARFFPRLRSAGSPR